MASHATVKGWSPNDTICLLQEHSTLPSWTPRRLQAHPLAMSNSRFDVAVIGGGMLGSAIAYGCAKKGARTLLLDQADAARRAARGNFGLVWSQGKGVDMPAYAAWTAQSLQLWPTFADHMATAAGKPIAYQAPGGLDFILGEEELETRRARLHRMHNEAGAMSTPVQMLNRSELEDLLPNTPLGPQVLGATYCPADGHVNPLLLLRALHAGFQAHQGTHRPGTTIATITPGFTIQTHDGATFTANKIVVAAGLGTPRLAAMIGINLPVRPVRGQNIVTERLPPMLPMPTTTIRQTDEGVVQIGASHEEGTDDPATSVAVLARLAARAIKVLPPLANARMVRSWAALRPMTPDGYAAYGQSPTHPGAFAAACHSGVTLSAAHAGPLAQAILAGTLPPNLAALTPDRFNVPAH